MLNNGYLKIELCTPETRIGDVEHNVSNIIKLIENTKASIIVFPELIITGIDAKDLFIKEYLYEENISGIKRILDSITYHGIYIFGSYIRINNLNVNCAFVCQKNKILGIVPKQNLTKDDENYFKYFPKISRVKILGEKIKAGSLLFKTKDCAFSITIDNNVLHENDYLLYLKRGVDLIINIASQETTIISNNFISNLKLLSEKYNIDLLSVSNNASVSTSEKVYSGLMCYVSNGKLISIKDELSLTNNSLLVECDIQYIHYLKNNNILQLDVVYDEGDEILIELKHDELNACELENVISSSPFLDEVANNFYKIIDMQAISVKKRLDYIKINKVIIGVSGGMDSTLALLSLVHMCEKYNISRKNIIAVTMPSTNNSSKTYNTSLELINKLNVTHIDINIDENLKLSLKMIKHENREDVTYENTQARIRTNLLMNLANKENALVIGTSNMSEIALGFSTFNGDHMAMYGINAGIPKTIVIKLVNYYKSIFKEVSSIIDTISSFPISPELTSNLVKSEDVVGNFEINDFILYHFMVRGATDERICFLLEKVFMLNKEQTISYLNNFMKRFFSSQYKRLTTPESVKIFSFNLASKYDVKLDGNIYKSEKK